MCLIAIVCNTLVNTGIYTTVESRANKTRTWTNRNVGSLRVITHACARFTASCHRNTVETSMLETRQYHHRWLCCVWQLRELPSSLCCHDFCTDRYNTSPSTPYWFPFCSVHRLLYFPIAHRQRWFPGEPNEPYREILNNPWLPICIVTIDK